MIQIVNIISNNLLLGLLLISLSVTVFAFINPHTSFRRLRLPRKDLSISIPKNEEEVDEVPISRLYRKICETPSKVCRQLFSKFGLRAHIASPINSVDVDNLNASPTKTFMPFRIEDLLTPIQPKRAHPFSSVTPKYIPIPKVSAPKSIKIEVKRGFMEGLVTETLSSLLHESVSSCDIIQDSFHLALKAIVIELALGFSRASDVSHQNKVLLSPKSKSLQVALKFPQFSSKVLMYFIWPFFLRSISHTAPAMAVHISAYELHDIITQF